MRDRQTGSGRISHFPRYSDAPYEPGAVKATICSLFRVQMRAGCNPGRNHFFSGQENLSRISACKARMPIASPPSGRPGRG